MTSFEEFFSRFGPERQDGDQGRSSLSLLGRSLVQSWVARIAAVGVIAGVAALAVVFVFSGSRVTAPSFIEKQLGSAAPVQKITKTGPTTVVTLGKSSGFSLAATDTKLTVAIESVDPKGGSWHGRQTGAVRKTSFGNEAIVVRPDYAEQFLTVDRHHGQKVWSWKLNSSLGTPRVGDDGYVAFIANHALRQDIVIKPVKLFDAQGESPRVW